MWRLYGFQWYHIGKGGYGFLDCFFFCVIEREYDYFSDNFHLLLLKTYMICSLYSYEHIIENFF